MDIVSFITILGPSVAFIIGVILIWFGLLQHSIRIQTAGWGIAAVTFVILVANFPSLRDEMYFWVTFFLVVAAFLSIIFVNQSARRDRTERYLGEVITWLRELESLILDSISGKTSKDLIKEIDILSKSGLPRNTWQIMRDLDETVTSSNSLRSEIRKGEYIQKLALKLDRDLGSLLKITLSHLKQRRECILDSPEPSTTTPEKESVEERKLVTELIEHSTESLDSVTLSERGRRTVLLGRNAGDIRKSIADATDKAIEIKMNLLQS